MRTAMGMPGWAGRESAKDACGHATQVRSKDDVDFLNHLSCHAERTRIRRSRLPGHRSEPRVSCRREPVRAGQARRAGRPGRPHRADHGRRLRRLGRCRQRGHGRPRPPRRRTLRSWSTFDADALFDYRARRPTLHIVDGRLDELTWPELAIRRVACLRARPARPRRSGTRRPVAGVPRRGRRDRAPPWVSSNGSASARSRRPCRIPVPCRSWGRPPKPAACAATCDPDRPGCCGYRRRRSACSRWPWPRAASRPSAISPRSLTTSRGRIRPHRSSCSCALGRHLDVVLPAGRPRRRGATAAQPPGHRDRPRGDHAGTTSSGSRGWSTSSGSRPATTSSARSSASCARAAPRASPAL